MEHSLRKVYRAIRNLSEGSSPEIAWDPSHCLIFRADKEELAYEFPFEADYCTACFERLLELGYIKTTINSYFYALTFKGLHPYQVAFEQLKQFILKSILTPIGVAIVTSILTTLVLNKVF